MADFENIPYNTSFVTQLNTWVVRQLPEERIWSDRCNGLEARRGYELPRPCSQDSERLLLHMPRRRASSSGIGCWEFSCHRDHHHPVLYILLVQNKRNKYCVWIFLRNWKKKRSFCSSCISSRKVEKLSMNSVQLSDLPVKFEDLEKSRIPEEQRALILSGDGTGDHTDLCTMNGVLLLVVVVLVVLMDSERLHIAEPLQLPGRTLIVDQRSWIRRKESLIHHRDMGAAEWEAAPTSCCAIIPRNKMKTINMFS